jgi:hypothetical protein
MFDGRDIENNFEAFIQKLDLFFAWVKFSDLAKVI